MPTTYSESFSAMLEATTPAEQAKAYSNFVDFRLQSEGDKNSKEFATKADIERVIATVERGFKEQNAGRLAFVIAMLLVITGLFGSIFIVYQKLASLNIINH